MFWRSGLGNRGNTDGNWTVISNISDNLTELKLQHLLCDKCSYCETNIVLSKNSFFSQKEVNLEPPGFKVFQFICVLFFCVCVHHGSMLMGVTYCQAIQNIWLIALIMMLECSLALMKVLFPQFSLKTFKLCQQKMTEVKNKPEDHLLQNYQCL